MTLIERLWEWGTIGDQRCREGADRIKELEAALQKIQGILEPIREISVHSRDAVDIARAAMGAKE
jgi:hypothetical protein